ncbi:hypothetical protein CPB83DRAFT_198738 [Crepidotus variabilis]|uniref:Uncharacterized protein n=1 Tax=Crepidotus variabilis TaxID=179855 RepID=A0A9P6EI18_9AGAR|nr:hypothetical protein CPB83DRAFT_198738 [Crepidotus variabilis]
MQLTKTKLLFNWFSFRFFVTLLILWLPGCRSFNWPRRSRAYHPDSETRNIATALPFADFDNDAALFRELDESSSLLLNIGADFCDPS